MQLVKLWHRHLSREQQSWATRYTTRWSRLLLKACFQVAWILVTCCQIRCSIHHGKYLWQQLCWLQIARQGQATVKPHHRLQLRRQQLQQILSTQPRRRLLQLCKMDLHLYFLKGGILLLGMVCIQISFLCHPRCSLIHRLLSR